VAPSPTTNPVINAFAPELTCARPEKFRNFAGLGSAAPAGAVETMMPQTSGSVCRAVKARCFNETRDNLFIFSIRVLHPIDAHEDAVAYFDAAARVRLQGSCAPLFERSNDTTAARRSSGCAVLETSSFPGAHAGISLHNYAAVPGAAERILSMTFAVIGSQ
jgi:hypothetical protein